MAPFDDLLSIIVVESMDPDVGGEVVGGGAGRSSVGGGITLTTTDAIVGNKDARTERGEAEEGCADGGGHVLGNFPNYAEFHSSSSRMELVDDEFWNKLLNPSHLRSKAPAANTTLRILDLGCNTGEFTRSLHEEAQRRVALHLPRGCPFSSVHTTGVDLDPALVAKAAAESSPLQDSLTFVPCDANTFLDATVDAAYDLVTLMSTTMWVHLNQGDAGLVHLLLGVRRVARVAAVVEPQPWACYTKAARRLRVRGVKDAPWQPSSLELSKDKLLAHISKLMSRGDRNDSEDAFEERVLGVTPWKRTISVYFRTYQ